MDLGRATSRRRDRLFGRGWVNCRCVYRLVRLRGFLLCDGFRSARSVEPDEIIYKSLVMLPVPPLIRKKGSFVCARLI